MKKFYFKLNNSITTLLPNAFKATLHFSKTYLAPFEQGIGQYAAIEAKNEAELKAKLEGNTFDLFISQNDKVTLFTNPVGE
jgi:hypothetical protein